MVIKAEGSLNLGDKEIHELIINKHFRVLAENDRVTIRQANQVLWSILVFAATGDADILVTEFEGSTSSGGIGDGIGAWKAVDENYNPSDKGAKAALYFKLATMTMVPGQRPDLYFNLMDDYRRRLLAMGKMITDDRFERWVLKAMPSG